MHCRGIRAGAAAPPAPRGCVPTIVRAMQQPQHHRASPAPAELASDASRRAALLALGAAAVGALGGTALPQAAQAKGGAATRTAGDFCPPSSTEGFVRYTPDGRATPSIRAGVIKAEPAFYSFDLPPTWAEGTILNILSGNFCMPKCDEPWYETVWESKEEGRCKLVVAPLYRLISKANATLKDLGPPEQVVERIGPFITGNYLDSVEDAVAMGTAQFDDGRTYYTYELVTPYAKEGAHSLCAFGIKVSCVGARGGGGGETCAKPLCLPWTAAAPSQPPPPPRRRRRRRATWRTCGWWPPRRSSGPSRRPRCATCCRPSGRRSSVGRRWSAGARQMFFV